MGAVIKEAPLQICHQVQKTRSLQTCVYYSLHRATLQRSHSKLLKLFTHFKHFKLFNPFKLFKLFNLLKLFKLYKLNKLFKRFKLFKLFNLFKLFKLFNLLKLFKLNKLFKLFKSSHDGELCQIYGIVLNSTLVIQPHQKVVQSQNREKRI